MEFLAEYGIYGLLVASFAAATVLPFSSEAILLAVLATGANPWTCVLVATIGNTAGGLTSYLLGYLGNWTVLEKYFGTSPEKAMVYRDRIRQYGFWFGLLCWLPVVGDVIAIALGLFRTPIGPVLLTMTTGKFLRYLLIMQAWLGVTNT